MTSMRNALKALFVICFVIHGGHSDLTAHQNRYLAHLFHKYGSHGIISFEGFEHLMHNLGLGGLEFSPKHTLDEHRLDGYKVPDFNTDEIIDITELPNERRSNAIDDTTTKTEDETTTNAAAVATDATTINANEATTIYSAENDYNIIKLMKAFDNDKQEDIFRTMHDPFHRHPRHRDHGHSSSHVGTTCLSPISLIELYVLDPMNKTQQNPIYRSTGATNKREARSVADDDSSHRHRAENEHEHDHDDDDEHHNNDGQTANDLNVANVKITPDTFLSMCPALLVQIEQGSCIDRHSEADPIIKPNKDRGTTSTAWISAVISVTIISLCGLVGVAMVPLTKFGAYHEILRFLVAIAIGTLCGDALMHLLPHALIPHKTDTASGPIENDIDHDHNAADREAVWICGCAFLAAVLMYSIETLLPLLGGGHGHSHNHNHDHDHTISPKQENTIGVCPVVSDRSTCGSCEDIENELEISKKNIEENVMVKDTTSVVRPWLTPVAFMVIIGDGLHNLTDGMAIGAAFGVDPVTGMATALAVLCHELPHELGDFALLLQTGVSLRRAFMLNIVSSVLSFIGMVIGLLIVNVNTEFVRWIYAGTAGTFLYIAFADLVPELGRTKVNGKTLFIQVFGIVLGGIIMLLIALYENNLKALFN